DQFIRGYLLRAFKAGALYDGERSLVAALSRPLIAERLVEVARIEQAADVAHTCAPGDERIAAAVRSLEPALNVIAVPRDGTVVASTPRPAGLSPTEAAFVDLTFERGTPAAINGIAMPLADLVSSLDIIARAHAVIDALRVLSTAHRHLQQTVAPKAGDDLRQRYAAVIDRGEWFSPERAELDAAVTRAQDKV